MTADPFDTYARLDPTRDERPDWDELGVVVLDAIDERARPMTIQIAPPDAAPSAGDERPDRNRRPRFVLAAAAALVAIAVAAIALAVRDREEVPADQPATVTTVAPPPEQDAALPTRQLDDHELAYVAAYAGTIRGGGVGAEDLELDFHDDGTFESTEIDGLCAMSGTWQVTTVAPALVADGRCGERTVTLVARPRPELLSGDWNSSDGASGSFEAGYEPATQERALTDEELAFVGEWVGTMSGPEGSAPGTATLGADGSFTSAGESTFFSSLDGHWEITPARLVSWTGSTSNGFTIRAWAPTDPEILDVRWSSSAGNSPGFEGTASFEPTD